MESANRSGWKRLVGKYESIGNKRNHVVVKLEFCVPRQKLGRCNLLLTFPRRSIINTFVSFVHFYVCLYLEIATHQTFSSTLLCLMPCLNVSISVPVDLFEPPHDRINKMTVRPAKTQISQHPPSLTRVFAVRPVGC